jgi:nitrogen fixation protein FixH
MRRFSPARAADGNGARWVPWLFVGAFLVVLAANATLVWVALGSFPGLETEGAYDKGLAYDETLAAAARQEALGWHAAIDLAPRGDGRTARLAVAFTDAAGAPVTGLEVEALFRRPTVAGLDSTVRLSREGGGRHGALVELAPGQWDMRIVARRGGETWQTVERVRLP